MPLDRRTLLRKLPAVPFAAGAAAMAAPTAVARFVGNAGGAATTKLTAAPWQTVTATAEEQAAWFMEDVAAMPKPGLPMPVAGDVMTMPSLRAFIQWEMYWAKVAELASGSGITIERAEELIGHSLRL